MTNDIVFIYATAPNAETARAIAQALVEAGLAACVNIFPGMTSVYRWKGAIETAEEIAMLAKTTEAAATRARDLILKFHPYETAAVVALRTNEAASSAAFCSWIRKNTGDMS